MLVCASMCKSEGHGKRGQLGLEFEGKVVIDWASKCGLDPFSQSVPRCIPQQVKKVPKMILKNDCILDSNMVANAIFYILSLCLICRCSVLFRTLNKYSVTKCDSLLHHVLNFFDHGYLFTYSTLNRMVIKIPLNECSKENTLGKGCTRRSPYNKD